MPTPLPSSSSSMGSALSRIRVSPNHSSYLETEDGRAYVPIGLNLCFPRFYAVEDDGLARYEKWVDALAGQGGNFIRLWLGHPFFDPEPGAPGEFDTAATSRLSRILDHCAERGIRVKLTIDHFRTLPERQEVEAFPGAASFSKLNYAKVNGGFARDMADFLDNPDCRAAYLRKYDWLSRHFANHPAVFGWELWNEMNAVAAEGWMAWTRAMLPELRQRFPSSLVMQSLGSFDADMHRATYAEYGRLEDADIVQVHRYLDPGADLAICRGRMDNLCADAIRELRALAPGKPIVLAECGAVAERHTGPSKLYEIDTEGLLLHDALFAPFFSGAAGPGQAWHWDYYVEKHDLWWHFSRFAAALSGTDPVAERFTPHSWQDGQLQVYALKGLSHSLAWCRDAASDWQTELVEKTEAEALHDVTVTPPWEPQRDISVYDPWSDRWSPAATDSHGSIVLPPFCRSLVVRF